MAEAKLTREQIARMPPEIQAQLLSNPTQPNNKPTKNTTVHAGDAQLNLIMLGFSAVLNLLLAIVILVMVLKGV